jgi:hypothetical protein
MEEQRIFKEGVQSLQIDGGQACRNDRERFQKVRGDSSD